MTRVYLVVIGLLLIVLGCVLWVDRSTDYRPRPLTLEQLQALPDERLGRQLIDDLALRAFAPGVARDAWQKFNEPSRHVWVLGVVESGCDEQGLGTFITYHAKDDGFPRIADARTAYAAIGLDEAAEALQPVGQAKDLAAVHQRWRKALERPDAVARRLAYLREHLASLADPFADAR